MNNWQNWAVALILLLCIVRIGQSIYSFFRGVKEKRNPCANCATGCELKNLYEKKRSECSEERKETKKKWFSITIWDILKQLSWAMVLMVIPGYYIFCKSKK